ncbi:MAG TPA: tetratricopeptide repeat protein [Bacteroidales bacterium]|nr:tetratricopeptide repeat protein [Bacteroidales bacterium]HRZ76447.1 tetratricopeptide repeat protein [Bacteroidales bacterium]
MKHIIRHILWAIPLLLLSCAAPKTGGKGAAAPAPVDPQVRSIFLDANREKVLGNSAEAEKLFRMVVDREPNNAAAHYELARLLHRSGRESEALEAARTASGLDPQNVWYTLYLAELYEDAGMPEKAVQLIEDLTQRYPDQEEYHEMLAGGYILLGRHADAIRTLDLMERKFGKNEDLLMQKRELYLQDGKFDKAMEETRKLSELSSRDTRYLLMMAEMHMDRGNKEEALALYRRVQDIDPGDPYIHMSLADYYRKAGDNEASFRELMLGMGNPRLDIDTKVQVLLSFYAVGELYDTLRKQGIALSGVLTRAHPDDPKSHSILADFLGRDGQYPGARESLMRVVELDSSKYIIWEQLLRIELQLKEYASMSSHARRATALFPNMPILYLLGGVAQYNRKEYTAAARSFELGLKLVVGDPRLKSDFHTYLGDTYQELGDYPNSTRNYQQALDIDPNNIYVLNNYSYFLSLRKDDLERAAQMAGRANELEPGNASYQDTYGWVLYVMGDYSGARTWLEKALASGGSDNAVILEHYADVLYKLGDIPGAREYWKKAAEKGKGSDLLQKKLRDGLLYE